MTENLLVQNDIMTYLQGRQAYVRKSKIITELQMHTKSQIIYALRKLRKDKRLRYGARR